jgi:hypothetical protein
MDLCDDETWTLDLNNLAKLLGVNPGDFSEECRNLVEGQDLRYKRLSQESRDSIILRVLKRLDDVNLTPSGEAYLGKWESGWGENRKDYGNTGDVKDLLPKFVKKNEVIRFEADYALPLSSEFETSFVNILRQFIFEKFLIGFENIYEFGAGTGHNLVQLAKIFPNARLVGADWSVEACKLMGEVGSNLAINLSSVEFDMFNPSFDLEVPQGSALITVGALEQLGEKHEDFFKFILKKKFKICIHFETSYELYDESKLFDALAMRYLEKRNWLRGFFGNLKKSEDDGSLKILYQKRTFGSLFHDGYTVTVWRPNNV